MSATLPVGVVLPTRDSIARLDAHLSGLAPWLGSVQQVVSVDSQSTDGTRKLLRRHLKHQDLRWLEHPPGLYASWNHGIASVEAKYTYISTVGDRIDPDGLARLVDVAESLSCDMVMSPPRFKSPAGQVLPDRWPLRDIIDQYGVERVTPIPPDVAVLLAALYLPHSILGSSASNLYRTEILKRSPFSTELGGLGDCGWGIANIRRLQVVIHPEPVADFVLHETHYRQDRVRRAETRRTLTDIAVRELSTRLSQLDVNPDAGSAIQCLRPDVEAWVSLSPDMRRLDCDLAADRSGIVPWFARPRAWRTYRARNEIRRRVRVLRARLLAGIPRFGQG